MPEEATHGKIQEAIASMELALLKERKTKIKIHFQMNEVASELVKVLKLKPPQ